jgi:hypothetical protein
MASYIKDVLEDISLISKACRSGSWQGSKINFEVVRVWSYEREATTKSVSRSS